MRRTLPRLQLLAASVTSIQCQLSELSGSCSYAVPGPDCVQRARQRLAGDSEEEVTKRQKQS